MNEWVKIGVFFIFASLFIYGVFMTAYRDYFDGSMVWVTIYRVDPDRTIPFDLTGMRKGRCEKFQQFMKAAHPTYQVSCS